MCRMVLEDVWLSGLQAFISIISTNWNRRILSRCATYCATCNIPETIQPVKNHPSARCPTNSAENFALRRRFSNFANDYQQMFSLMTNDLPKDPMMLLSFVNMKLRDQYPSLEELCAAMDVEQEWIVETLRAAGFEYSEEHRRFW